MIESLFKGVVRLFGSHNERQIKLHKKEADQITSFEPALEKLDDTALQAKTDEFRTRLKNGETIDDISHEVFAVVREASKRVPPPGEDKGLRHYDVQMVGGLVLHRSGIAEMSTGEGKTLVATCPAYLNALEGKGVHVITVNDYLAQRDRDWMAPIFQFLGLTVGAIQSEMDNADRRAQYECDITYGTNNEFGFDYLRDNMKSRLEDQVQRSRHYAILDEVDNILIDEARTPLIISGPSEGETRKYFDADRIARKLEQGRDFEIKEKESQALLTEEGIVNAQNLANVDSFYTGANMEWPHLLEQALRAHFLFFVDKDYMIGKGDEGKTEIVIIDEFTGRAMPGRRWSDGLHQAIEAKESITIRAESQTLASITFQNFFKLYDKLAGMTGTALTEAGEFLKIYGLNVVAIPTNRPIRRDDLDDKIYADQSDKYRAVVDEIKDVHASGRPILVGTTSIEVSEKVSKILERNGIEHNVLNAKHHEREAEIITNAGQRNAVTIATNMAGRGTDIKLGKGIADAGGLHVLGTERHEARRIDNQLRGRGGRQGDPGSTRFFLALDDDLMRRFASDNIASLLKKLGLKDGQAIEHKWINKSIANAQKKVENRNFEIRKSLLEYDNVMNEQRKIVYDRRARILEGRELRALINTMFEAVIDYAVETYIDPELPANEWDWEALETWHQKKTGDELKLDHGLKDLDDIADVLKASIKANYDQCYEKSGDDRMAVLERYLLLNAFDVKWKEHLANMDALKSGIGLRSFAQIDPKVEYRREALTTFEEMIVAIQEEVTDLILRVEMRQEEVETAKDVWSDQEANKEQFGQYDASRQQQDAAASRAQSVKPAKPFVHTKEQVGRNEACPCGSGKKYKKCHGANA
ncbi:MAG: preprotein translocase subunit SecA [Planctomycetota bacterium]|jgi:preprotein translocase subunit SecA